MDYLGDLFFVFSFRGSHLLACKICFHGLNTKKTSSQTAALNLILEITEQLLPLKLIRIDQAQVRLGQYKSYRLRQSAI